MVVGKCETLPCGAHNPNLCSTSHTSDSHYVIHVCTIVSVLTHEKTDVSNF